MFVTELREGPIRNTIEAALNECPEAMERFREDDMAGVMRALSTTRTEKCMEAYRLMRLIGLDGRHSPSDIDAA